MKWISNLVARYWRNVHFVSILVLSLALLFAGPDVTSLVSATITKSFHYPFFELKRTVTTLVSVREDNRWLQQALVEASIQLSQLEETERENERLRVILGFDPPPNYTLIPAEVISVVGERTPVAAVINRGRDHGVRQDLSLINQQGLIGRVISVSTTTATVQLLTDPTSRVAARIAESREMGIVRNRTKEGLILDNFPIQGSIKVGDQVISSGLGGIYPPGLLIGSVDRVERPEEELFCRIGLVPAAVFSSLEELFILQPIER